MPNLSGMENSYSSNASPEAELMETIFTFISVISFVKSSNASPEAELMETFFATIFFLFAFSNASPEAELMET